MNHINQKSLFPTHLPERTWEQFQAAGFEHSVSGMIFRANQPPCCGVALGGLGTGCLDIQATGVFGFSSIFTAPRRDLRYGGVFRNPQWLLPFLGMAVEGKTWVLAKEQYLQGGTIQGCTEPIYSDPENKVNWQTETSRIEGVEPARDILYWGHYPIADLEYEIDAPIGVGLRAWAPFVPGDLGDSSIPAAVFEVHLRNPGEHEVFGTLAFNFPGPLNTDPPVEEFMRLEVFESFRGLLVTTPETQIGYVIAVMDAGEKEEMSAVRIGGGLCNSPDAWSQIATRLPTPPQKVKNGTILYTDPGASIAVDFKIRAGESSVTRFLLTWYSPFWTGGNYKDLYFVERLWGTGPYALPGRDNDAGVRYQAMYATHYENALGVAWQMAREHVALLSRVLAWQQEIYRAEELPVWLRDCLVNNLNLITEDSYWAQPKEPLGTWSFPEGAFNLVESPRACAIMGCIVSNWYGDLPILYFFPQLERMLLRDYAEYLRPDGAVPFLWPNGDFSIPTYEYLLPLNGPCFVDLVGRLWLRTGDDDVLHQFYPAIKRNTQFTMSLKPAPEGIISVHRGGVGEEWWEHTPVYGMVTHVGGMRLSSLRIVQRMAEAAGDREFAAQCQEWFATGSQCLEEHLWAGDSYLFYFDPQGEEKEFEYLKDVSQKVGAPQKKSDDIMSSQLDGEWANRFHGLGGVFRPERVKQVLETLQKTCLVDCGMAGFANRNGTPDLSGYGTFPPEITLVGMTYMYHHQQEVGLEIVRRNMDNLVRKQGYAWDLPNLVRCDTGARTMGTDYFQNMVLWGVPAALAGKDLRGPCEPGGLVDRVLRAGQKDSNESMRHDTGIH